MVDNILKFPSSKPSANAYISRLCAVHDTVIEAIGELDNKQIQLIARMNEYTSLLNEFMVECSDEEFEAFYEKYKDSHNLTAYEDPQMEFEFERDFE